MLQLSHSPPTSAKSSALFPPPPQKPSGPRSNFDSSARFRADPDSRDSVAQVEEQGWDVDFYAGCVYNRTRTPEEWKQVLHGESLEMAQEIYLRSDPPRMYKVMRQTRKPCFAFKILAAGRLSEQQLDAAFQTAFESIKPIDGVFVGIFPRIKDEIRDNVERLNRVLKHG